MRIDCPLCGLRPNAEFTILGDAKNQRPDAGTKSGKDWHDYVYLRDNNKGWINEYWQHTGGCRAWLVVERNNVSHDIGSVILARERKAK